MPQPLVGNYLLQLGLASHSPRQRDFDKAGKLPSSLKLGDIEDTPLYMRAKNETYQHHVRSGVGMQTANG